MAIQGQLNTLTNGNIYSWQETHVYVNNIPVICGAFQELNYTPKQSSQVVKGNQIAGMGKTPGYGEVEGDFTMLIDIWDDFNSQITSLATSDGSTMNTDFSMVVMYAIGDSFNRTDTINGMRITSTKVGKGSGDEIVVTAQFIAMQLLENGIPAFTAGGVIG